MLTRTVKPLELYRFIGDKNKGVYRKSEDLYKLSVGMMGGRPAVLSPQYISYNDWEAFAADWERVEEIK